MARRNPITRTDYDISKLAEELKARFPTAETALVTPDDMLAVIDVDGNELDVAPAIVQQVIAAHVPPIEEPDPIDDLVIALSGSGTTAQKLAALKIWATKEKADRERRIRPPRRAQR